MKAKLFAALLGLCPMLSLAEPTQGIVFPIKQVSVYSPVLQEIITEMLVEEGHEVKEGQIVVQLRNDREKLDVQLSEKLIELKRFIALGNAKLYKDKMGSEEKALESKTDLELSEMQKSAKQLALDEKTIRAPLSGTVVKKYKESGEAVDRTEKLLDIVNYDQVYVQFYVRADLRKTLTKDTPMKVKIVDLEGAEFEGKVSFIDPRNEATSPLVRVKVQVDNKEHRIKPGMKGSAEFSR
jgi:membrane fusion protein (multidrug efflux system)